MKTWQRVPTRHHASCSRGFSHGSSQSPRGADITASTTHDLRDLIHSGTGDGQEIWLHNCRDRGDQASVFAGRAIDPPDPQDPGQGQ